MKIKLVSGIVLVSLLLIGLVGAMERGPLRVPIYLGANPLNGGPLGLTELYKILKENRTVILVTDWRKVNISCGNALVFIISPEIEYTREEVEAISRLAECQYVRIIIADETGNANELLRALGSSVSVGSLSMGSTFAYFSTPWGEYMLLLDKPAPLDSRGGAVPLAREISMSPSARTYAYLEGRIVVIGDGSIFLNQVLKNEKTYLNFTRSMVDYMCNGCTVLLDASKSEAIDGRAIIRGNLSSELLALIDPLNLALAIISEILHPSTWLLPLVKIVNSITAQLLGMNYVRDLLLFFAVVLLLFLNPIREKIVGDKPLEDVKEVDWYGYAGFSERLLSKGAQLRKEDFISLYNMINMIISSSTGSTLHSSDVVPLLVSRGIEKEKAESFVRYMNKYYARAIGKSWWPPIVLWGRTTRKAISMSEEVMNALGYSIMDVRGFEERIL